MSFLLSVPIIWYTKQFELNPTMSSDSTNFTLAGKRGEFEANHTPEELAEFDERTDGFNWDVVADGMQQDLAVCMDHFMQGAVAAVRERSRADNEDPAGEVRGGKEEEVTTNGDVHELRGLFPPQDPQVMEQPGVQQVNTMQFPPMTGDQASMVGMLMQLLQQQHASGQSSGTKQVLELLPKYVEGGKTDVFTFTDLVREQVGRLPGQDFEKVACIILKLGDDERQQVLDARANTGSVQDLLEFMEATFDVYDVEALKNELHAVRWTEGSFFDTYKKLAALHSKAKRRRTPFLRPLEIMTHELLSTKQRRELARAVSDMESLTAKQLARAAENLFDPKPRLSGPKENRAESKVRSSAKQSSSAPAKKESGCHICGKEGHWKRECPQRTKEVAAVGDNVWIKRIHVNNAPIRAVIDTGAGVSVMTLSLAERLLRPDQLLPFNGRLKGIGGLASCEIHQITRPISVVIEGQARDIQFWVVNDQNGWEGKDLYIGFEAIRGRSLEEIARWAKEEVTRPTPKEWKAVAELPSGKLREAKLPAEETPRLGVKENPTPYQAPGVRIQPRYREALKTTLGEMVEDGIIERTHDDTWAARPVIVPKEDGRIRLTVDFRWLNAQCHDQVYLPRTIKEIVQTLARSRWFTRLDLKSGYHQIPLHPGDREYTGFRTPFGLYRYLRLPQGVKNAPPIFQKIMETVLAGLPEERVAVYLDDVIVGGDSIEELESLEGQVIERLANLNLQLNVAKSERNVGETNLLGWRVSFNAVKPPEERIESIEEWPTPGSRGELQRFLGAIGFFRHCVAGMAILASPLYRKLSKEGTPFPLDEEERAAVDHLKAAVRDSGVQAEGDHEFEYHLATDASAIGLGAVLLHIHPTSKETRTLGFWSHHLQPAERNYSATKLELMGIIRALEHFEDFTTGRQVIVHTDHKPLLGLIWGKDPAPVIWRWLERLFRFDFRLVHIQGKDNVIADYLSRIPLTGEVATVEGANWAVEQAKDPKIEALRRFLLLGEVPSSRPEKLIVKSKPKGLEMANDTVCVKGRVYVPSHMVQEAIKDCMGGAENIQEVRRKVETSFYIPNLQRQVASVARQLKPDITSRPAGYKSKVDELVEEAPAIEEKEREEPLEEEEEEAEGEPVPCWEIDSSVREAYVRLQGEDSLCHSWQKTLEREGAPPTGLTLKDGVWFKQGKLFVPSRGVEAEMARIHQKGHFAASKLVGTFQQSMCGPTPWKYARKAVTDCEICTRLKTSMERVVGMATPTFGPTQVVHADFFGPVSLTRNGNKYALVLVDTFSGFVEAYPLSHQDTSAALYGLTQWVTHYGTPRILVSDQGAAFIGEAFRQMLAAHSVDHRVSSAFHPQGNGAVEVRNRIIKDVLRKLTSAGTEDWDLMLPWALAAINASPHVRHGYSPHFVMFGRKFHFPDEVLWEGATTVDQHVASVVRVHTTTQRIVFEAIENSRKEAVREPSVEFAVGEWVWAKDPSEQESKSFGSEWNGPFKVVERISQHLYRIQRRDRLVIYNVSNLKKKAVSETREEKSVLPQEEEKRPEPENRARRKRSGRRGKKPAGFYSEAKL